jgi:uncharacterized membrane protein YphA (DoxX/SURF4 family)
MQPDIDPGPRWSLGKRIAFRFAFSYFFAFFIEDEPVGFIPFYGVVIRPYVAFWHAVVVWVGRQVLHTRYELDIADGGVNNTAHGSILFLCYLAAAALATVVWSVLDRKRASYVGLQQGFRLLLRLSLALALIRYGTLKLIPTQMIAPTPPFLLLQRFGELRPMQLLWMFVGSSPAYESFTGGAELLGGLLLLLPRTTLLGALVAIGDMTMVVVLNFCYDVHVKLYSMHLLAMAVLLVLPDLRRLADLFLFNRTVEAAPARPLFGRRRVDLALQGLVLLMGLAIVGKDLHESYVRYKPFHPPRPPLYGAWSVDEFTVDGKEVPLYTDPQRWRWVVFQSPGRLTVEQMIGSRPSYTLALDLRNRTMALERARRNAQGTLLPATPAAERARFSFDASQPDALILDGTLDGHPTHARLSRMELSAAKFHWIIVISKEDR